MVDVHQHLDVRNVVPGLGGHFVPFADGQPSDNSFKPSAIKSLSKPES
jgi:hypothetical protein